jgi:hypothetical protein
MLYPTRFQTAEEAMWRLVTLYTGKTRYRRGIKAEGLAAAIPEIDCSGWTAFLLESAIKAENEAVGAPVFDTECMLA